MTAVPKAPPHPLDGLATWQLRDYRAALESALPGAPHDSADRTLIEKRLAAVIAEQEERVNVFMREPYAAAYRRFADQ
jgi:hypothetical protein